MGVCVSFRVDWYADTETAEGSYGRAHEHDVHAPRREMETWTAREGGRDRETERERERDRERGSTKRDARPRDRHAMDKHAPKRLASVSPLSSLSLLNCGFRSIYFSPYMHVHCLSWVFRRLISEQEGFPVI